MGSVYLTNLAAWCREEGLRVAEVEDWERRARSSGGYESGRPWCIMWHHTASVTSPSNDANYMCFGSPDAPLANLLVARDGEVWVMAGGATNTNGKGRATAFSKGTVPADSMNTYAVGVEIANSGIGEAYPRAQIDAMFLLNNMLTRRLGLYADDCCTHQDYAPDRKIDPATADAVQGPWSPSAVTSSGTWSRTDVQEEAARRTGSAPEPEDDVQVVEIQVEGANASFLGYRVQQAGMALILWVEWVDGNDPAQLQRLQNYRDINAPVHRMTSIDDFKGVALLGPVPQGDGKYNWTRDNFGNVM